MVSFSSSFFFSAAPRGLQDLRSQPGIEPGARSNSAESQPLAARELPFSFFSIHLFFLKSRHLPGFHDST